MNKVILKGNLGRDPEVRVTNTGKKVARISVGVQRFAKKDAPKVTDWFSCVAWEKTADIIESYFTKGTPILIEGNLRTYSYDGDDGVKRFVTEVVIERVEFCGGGKQAGASNGNSPAAQQPGDVAFENFGPADNSKGAADDIPF